MRKIIYKSISFKQKKKLTRYLYSLSSYDSQKIQLKYIGLPFGEILTIYVCAYCFLTIKDIEPIFFLNERADRQLSFKISITFITLLFGEILSWRFMEIRRGYFNPRYRNKKILKLNIKIKINNLHVKSFQTKKK